MKNSHLLTKKDITDKLRKKFANNHRDWLAGNGSWPLPFALGVPSEKEAATNIQSVQQWQEQWHEWRGEGKIVWIDRRWPWLGTQKLPEKIVFQSARQIVSWIGEMRRWDRAIARYRALIEKWPLLAGLVNKQFNILADYTDEDFERVVSTLAWLEVNPASGLYIRQLPIPGIHSKWLENKTALFGRLLKRIQNDEDSPLAFYEYVGIRTEPILLRFRVLDPQLRALFGGLRDISAPIEEIASLQLPLKCVFIVENLQTGLSFGDLSGAIVFLKKGYDVNLYAGIPWLKTVPCYYWGDLDTHGLAILNRLRSYFPDVRSFLMDKSTLLSTRKSLWSIEDEQSAAERMSWLTPEEHQLYTDLRNNIHGENVRLEQERIPWGHVWETIQQIHSQNH